MFATVAFVLLFPSMTSTATSSEPSQACIYQAWERPNPCEEALSEALFRCDIGFQKCRNDLDHKPDPVVIRESSVVPWVLAGIATALAVVGFSIAAANAGP